LGRRQWPRPAHGRACRARLCACAGSGQDLGAAGRQKARANVIAYLKHARQFDYADNNWKFFRIFVDIALDRVGAEFDRSLTKQYLEELESFYIGDGWYRDGNVSRVDHYIPFAMHFYGLIYSKLVDDDYAQRYRERAILFARDFRRWFAPDGATIPFGRSLTYRFACAGFWSALAFADVEALPWGEVKHLCLQHLRWWSDKPMTNRDGILSIGFGYPNLLMSESYNSAGSPYWAFKAFLPLAIAEDHPFWTATEKAPATAESVSPQRHPGMVLMRRAVMSWRSRRARKTCRCGLARRNTPNSPIPHDMASASKPMSGGLPAPPSIRRSPSAMTVCTTACARRTRKPSSPAICSIRNGRLSRMCLSRHG
jgi:hypothetical protein